MGKILAGIKRAMMKVLKMGVSFVTLRWLAGGRQGPPPIETAVEEAADEPGGDLSVGEKFESETNPYARKREGFEPLDVIGYIGAGYDKAERAKAGALLRPTTKDWVDSLKPEERRAILSMTPKAIADHLSGAHHAEGLPSVKTALVNKLKNPLLNPNLDREPRSATGERLTRPHFGPGTGPEMRALGRRANDLVEPRIALAISNAAKVSKDEREVMTDRRRRAAASSALGMGIPMPRRKR